jgi:hypothetical protein
VVTKSEVVKNDIVKAEVPKVISTTSKRIQPQKEKGRDLKGKSKTCKRNKPQKQSVVIQNPTAVKRTQPMRKAKQ